MVGCNFLVWLVSLIETAGALLVGRESVTGGGAGLLRGRESTGEEDASRVENRARSNKEYRDICLRSAL